MLPATEGGQQEFFLLTLGSMTHSVACQFALSQRGFCLPRPLFGLYVCGQNL